MRILRTGAHRSPQDINNTAAATSVASTVTAGRAQPGPVALASDDRLRLSEINDFNFSSYALHSIGKLMQIYTVRNETLQGYFYTISPTTGDCIFQCFKEPQDQNETREIIKKRFRFKDIVFIQEMDSDRQIAQIFLKKEPLLRNLNHAEGLLIDEEIAEPKKANNSNSASAVQSLARYEFPLLAEIPSEPIEDESTTVDSTKIQQDSIAFPEEFSINAYSTHLDLARIPQEDLLNATQLEQEVYAQTSTNPHLLDDRNDTSVHITQDDHTLYTLVRRKQQQLSTVQQEVSRPGSEKGEPTGTGNTSSAAAAAAGNGSTNLKGKTKKLRLAKQAFEPPLAHIPPSQNERFQVNKMVNQAETFNVQQIFIDRLKSSQKETKCLEYVEEKLINVECSWRSFLCDEKRVHNLLFNSLMVKSGHTSSGSSIGGSGFHQSSRVNNRKLNQFFNHAALAMTLNMQTNLNGSFNSNNTTQNNLNLSQTLNNSFSSLNNYPTTGSATNTAAMPSTPPLNRVETPELILTHSLSANVSGSSQTQQQQQQSTAAIVASAAATPPQAPQATHQQNQKKKKGVHPTKKEQTYNNTINSTKR